MEPVKAKALGLVEADEDIGAGGNYTSKIF
jgi:hypothetical protein